MKHSSRRPKGQIMIVLAVVLPALIGAMALCADVAMFYFNWANLQKAADAAALAGANALPNNLSKATTDATNYALTNGVLGGEITSITFGAANTQITVRLSRQVPYYFARVLGLTDAPVSVLATAAINDIVRADNPIPVGLQKCSSGKPMACYKAGDPMTLKPFDPKTKVGSGNWQLLDYGSIGGGGKDIRSGVATGCQCSVPAGGWVDTNTMTGMKVGPVQQGLQDRIDAANASFPGETTAATASSDNPRFVTLPVVDFTGVKGKSRVPVYGFVVMFITNAKGSGDINAVFMTEVTPGEPGSTNDTLAKAPRLIQ
ncbi:MAG: pilus assembly protein TadG-related protein [Candidatus Binataceae bacterium]